MWAYLFALLVGAGGAAWGTWQVQEWRWKSNTADQREAEHQARDSDARQQRRFNDQAAGAHAHRGHPQHPTGRRPCANRSLV